MKRTFKVAIPAYNASAYIERCLQSLERQKERNYEVCVVDDASSEELQKEIIHRYCQRNGWQAIFSKQNEGGIASLVKGFNALEIRDEDVYVQLDGDDWLFGEHVFRRVNEEYDKGALATLGSAMRSRDTSVFPERFYSKYTKKKGLFRQRPFAMSHLRTFKGILWRYVQDEDLRDETGNYWRIGGDCPMWFPLCELAGSRLKLIPEILYVYNDQNPISDQVRARTAQLSVELRARQSPVYPSLDAILSGRATH